MNDPLISIITPTFNCGAKLRATAASVLSQDEGLYEFLVIDGASTDNTVSILQELGGVRWVSEPDRGIYDAMNKGVHMARGKFLYFLGAGDCLRPGILHLVAELLSTNGDDLQLVYGDVNWGAPDRVYGGVFNGTRLARQNICHQAIFYSRGIFDLLGDYDCRYKYCADYAMNIRCFGEKTIRKGRIDAVIADYETGGGSESPDRAFCADIVSLVWSNLSFIAALHALYYHSKYLRWARSLNYHLRQPWRTFPRRVLRRMRGLRVFAL